MFDDENFNVFRDEAAAKEKQKVNRAKLPRRARNFSKEQLQLALRKKKECNAKAQRIVESLLDPVKDVDEFTNMLKHINQCHFEDVVQERAIQKVCGYPLCQKELTNVPQQKYVISLPHKKIYDITERKNFCSGECYKASNFIKEQMLTSPLWLRDQEDIPPFKLLSKSSPLQIFESEVNHDPRVAVMHTDAIQIIERTYSEHNKTSKNSACNASQHSINEGSEIDLIIKEKRNEQSSTEDNESLDSCLGKMSLND